MKRFLNQPKVAWRNTVFAFTMGISSAAVAGVTGLQATNDSANSYYQFNYTGSPSFMQVFLDTDRNSSTGLRVAGVGANFLIENNALYRYSGSGTNWSWSRVSSVVMSNSAPTVRFSVARSALGSPSSIALVGSVNPPESFSGVIVQNLVTQAPITAPQATSDSTSVSYQYSYTGAPAFRRLYLDTDRSASTGFSVGGIGANFLIENGNLFRYSGSGGFNWGWTAIKSVSFSNLNNIAKWSLLRTDLGSPSSVDLIAQVEAPMVTSGKVTQTLTGSVPAPAPEPAPAPAPVPAPQPAPAPAPAPAPTPVPAPTPNPSPVGQVSYAPSSAIFPNPERGMHSFNYCDSGLWNIDVMKNYRAQGISIVGCIFYLTNYRNSDLPQSALDFYQQNMNNIRAAGMKVFVRFAYTQNTSGDDASAARVMRHIDQLTPLFQKNKDVIFLMQAGFIGAWGEWAYSQNFGTTGGALTAQNWADRKAVVDKLLQALPANRQIQIRTPGFKTRLYGSAALTASQAFNGSAQARVAHHNDCFLASANDWGTYSNISVEYPYLQQETKYLAMGGETCNVAPPRSDCATALKEMEMFHWSYLHQDYHATVLQNFKNQGCYDTIRTKLGYRFVLQNGSFSSQAKLGGTINVSLSLVNQGFASPFNPRPLELILRNNSTGAVHRLKLNSDPRHWLPGSTITVTQTLSLPSNIVPGNYSLLLNLPDEDAALSARPEYSIQLANTGVWEATTGFNNLKHTISISQ